MSIRALSAAVAAVVLSSVSCTSPVTAEEVAAATLYFPPEVRRIDAPRFCFSLADRRKALDSYRETGADTLFEIVIDDRGEVVLSRLVRTHVRGVYHADLEAHAERFEFTSDGGSGEYRAFYFPVAYDHDTTFEWL